MNGPLSRRAVFRPGLVLSAVFSGAGPGVTGRVEFGVRPLARGFQTWHWDDDSVEAYKLSDVRRPYTWSAAAQALAASELGGEVILNSISVTGATANVADVLRLAWGTSDQKRLAWQLATCTEEQLDSIREEVGPLTSPAARRRLDPLAAALDQAGEVTFGSLITLPSSTGALVAALRRSIRAHQARLNRVAREQESARKCQPTFEIPHLTTCEIPHP